MHDRMKPNLPIVHQGKAAFECKKSSGSPFTPKYRSPDLVKPLSLRKNHQNIKGKSSEDQPKGPQFQHLWNSEIQGAAWGPSAYVSEKIRLSGHYKVTCFTRLHSGPTLYNTLPIRYSEYMSFPFVLYVLPVFVTHSGSVRIPKTTKYFP